MRPVSLAPLSPLIISAGLNGSGSTWVFNLIAAIIRRNDPPMRIRTVYSDEFLEDIPTDDVDITVVKSHRLSPNVQAVARLAAIPVILTVRDPKDGVASLMTRFGFTYDQAIYEVGRSAEALAPLAGSPGVLTLRYEDGFTKERATIKTLADRLGVSLSVNYRDAIWRTLTPKAVRTTIEKLAAEGAFAAGEAALTFDPDTHWHPGHVGDGRVGGWRSVLSDQQAFDVHCATATFCAAFGYADERSPGGFGQAREPERDDPAHNDTYVVGVGANAAPRVEGQRTASAEANEARVATLEADRLAQGLMIERLAAELEVRDAQLAASIGSHEALVQAIAVDRASRDTVIERLAAELDVRGAQLEALNRANEALVQAMDVDRAVRDTVIERLTAELDVRGAQLLASSQANEAFIQTMEMDRAARETVIQQLMAELDVRGEQVEAASRAQEALVQSMAVDRAAQDTVIERLATELEVRGARLEALSRANEALVQTMEVDRAARDTVIERLAAELELRGEQLAASSRANEAVVEAMNVDRAARDSVIETLQHHLGIVDRDRDARL